MPLDLAIEAFAALRAEFFDGEGKPRTFRLRDKRNTQDDPFDEMVAAVLANKTPEDVRCDQASGPLITPDMALYRPELCNGLPPDQLSSDTSRIVGLEVKKLERSAGGKIARASGLDYNSTPPCGTVRAYDANGSVLDLRCFYLFVCLEWGTDPGTCSLSALCLCDGNALNSDFDYYLSVAGQRSKEIGVGSYGDGANRNRPMVIFANPLGAPQLDHAVTLIHGKAGLASGHDKAQDAGKLRRRMPDGTNNEFSIYMEQAPDGGALLLNDPFPTPANRSEKTTGRGKFLIGVRPSN